MLAAVVEGAHRLAVRDVPMPEMGPYDALVKIDACGICNSTDSKILARKFVSSIPVPLILGHESVGTVVEVGPKVTCFEVGQRVLRPGASYDLAKTGLASAWGGLAEYGLVTDRAAWLADHPGGRAGGMWAKQQVVPAHIDPAEATGIITLKETLFALRAAGVDHSTWTAIVGTGPVARSFTYWAHWLGVPFLVVFGRQERWCHDFMALGANNYVAGDRPCAQDDAKWVGLRAFDRAIDAVGSSQSLRDALALVRETGLVGNYGVSPEDDHESQDLDAARAGGRIVNLPVREEEVHDEVVGLVEGGQLDLAPWVSHRLPLTEIQQGFELLETKQALKVVIEI